MSAAVSAPAMAATEAAVRAATETAVRAATETAVRAAAEAGVSAAAVIHVGASTAAKSARSDAAAIAASSVVAAAKARSTAVGVSAAKSAAEAVSAATIAAPAVAGPVQAAIPTKAKGAAHAKVWIGAPSPNPGRGQPCPPVAGVIHIGIRGGVVGRAFVGVLIAVRHPDPAVLLRVHPLARGRSLIGRHGLLHLPRLRLNPRLNRRIWQLRGWCRRLQVGRGRGRLHLCLGGLVVRRLVVRDFDEVARAFIGPRGTGSQEQERKTGS